MKVEAIVAEVHSRQVFASGHLSVAVGDTESCRVHSGKTRLDFVLKNSLVLCGHIRWHFRRTHAIDVPVLGLSADIGDRSTVYSLRRTLEL